jgi:hypothetical protein
VPYVKYRTIDFLSVSPTDHPSVRPTKNWFFLPRVIGRERSERRRDRERDGERDGEREKHVNLLRGEMTSRSAGPAALPPKDRQTVSFLVYFLCNICIFVDVRI